jgi:transcriptional repressor NrdR
VLYLLLKKTTVSFDQVDNIILEVERELLSSDSVEVESQKIGEMIAERLKKVDKVAYIRFSSVFREFVDVEEFEKEIKKLLKKG